MTDYTILKQKLSYFKDNKISVHIIKHNGRFHNGLILELAGDMIILDEEVAGAMPIYFEEIKDVEKRRERE
jgi:hypothetical protein